MRGAFFDQGKLFSSEGKGGLERARKTAPSPPLTAEPTRSCNLDSPGPFTAIRIVRLPSLRWSRGPCESPAEGSCVSRP